MKHVNAHILLSLCLTASMVWTACQGASNQPSNASATKSVAIDPSGATPYLAKLAPMLMGRVLNVDERKQLQAQGVSAIDVILNNWANDVALSDAARHYIEEQLFVSGTRDDIDFSLPGNLAAVLVRDKRPWSEILTADKCYDQAGSPVACDTGAPYNAGVLTTRAYMVSRASRFNLTRAGTMMRVFTCQHYPMDNTLQPPLPKEVLLPMFQAMTLAEQTEERAKSTFGNGDGCYTCHSQFGAHAQLFVKFDRYGKYKVDATGLQDPNGELGRSTNDLMVSHFTDPSAAKSEASQMFGQSVDNLSGAIKILVNDPRFGSCMVRNLIKYVLDVEKPDTIPDTLLSKIASKANTAPKTGTFQDYVVSTFAEPSVAQAVIEDLRR